MTVRDRLPPRAAGAGMRPGEPDGGRAEPVDCRAAHRERVVGGGATRSSSRELLVPPGGWPSTLATPGPT
jgi:hypothetical protein